MHHDQPTATMGFRCRRQEQDAGSAATHPRLAPLGDGFVVVWREDSSHWRTRLVAVAPE